MSASIVSYARYGQTAEAPKPSSSATWWISLTSPASMISAALVRRCSATRRWCTAETSSRLGIAACVLEVLRSERITMCAPPRTCSTTSSVSLVVAWASRSPGLSDPSTSKSPSTTTELKPLTRSLSWM